MEKTKLFNTAYTESRRTFVRNSVMAFAAMSLPRLTSAALSYAVTPLSKEINVITGVGGNVLAFSSDDGILLVDSGGINATGTLQDVLGNLAGGSNVHTLFNTHWHTGQVSGNGHFARQGARIIAHQKTLLHLSTDYYLFDEDRYQRALPVDAHPVETFYTNANLQAGNEMIEYGYLALAHTDGDIYVRFPEANVIAVGDVVSPGIDPVFDWYSGGWIGGRVDALNQIIDMCDEQTRIVPSYGSAEIGKAHVEAERDLMQFLYDTLVDQIRMGFNAEDSLASGIMDNLPRKFSDPYKFLYDAHKGLWAHHNKLEPNIV